MKTSRILLALALVTTLCASSPAQSFRISDLLNQDRDYATVPAESFGTLGWSLPDGGRAVKALADAAPGGAFDPRKLEALPATDLGYRAKWHVVRYKFYGVDWDITGLQLTPEKPGPGLPTLAIINGGSANFYEFFLDPLNRPGLGQYLAQRMPVMIITILGNYIDGGWTTTKYEERIPGYLLNQSISAEEAGIRNAIYTFSLVSEGVRQLLEKTTTGPLFGLFKSPPFVDPELGEFRRSRGAWCGTIKLHTGAPVPLVLSGGRGGAGCRGAANRSVNLFELRFVAS